MLKLKGTSVSKIQTGDNPRMSAMNLIRSRSANSLRKNAGHLQQSASTETRNSLKMPAGATIESEYIRNLQQQIYFLELESSFLREQHKKTGDGHPEMSAEAERMLFKLQSLQTEVDNLKAENKQKDAVIQSFRTETRTSGSKRSGREEDSASREKKLLVEEIVQLRKDLETLQQQAAEKESESMEENEEKEKWKESARNADAELKLLHNQLEHSQQQLRLSQTAVEEKRTELLKRETEVREMEEQLHRSATTVQDKVVQDLREELRNLRQKLKETEQNVEQDQLVRNKMAEDNARLIRDNALLQQQTSEMESQLQHEHSLRESTDSRRSMNLAELVGLKDREKQLTFDLQQAHEQLNKEQTTVRQILQKLASHEQTHSHHEHTTTTVREKLRDLQERHQATKQENTQLRNDKKLLINHVSELQAKVDRRDQEVGRLVNEMREMERRIQELDHLKELETSLQHQKWEEFRLLAEGMKNLTRSVGSGPPEKKAIESS